jgi:hypothetical protein
MMRKVRKTIKLVLILTGCLLALLTSACNKSYQVIPVDPQTGYFSNKKPDPAEILKNQPLSGIDEYKIIYLRGLNACDNHFCLNYVRSMIANVNQFETIFTKTELEQFIIKNGLSNSITNISDLVGLNQLSQKIGKFLVVDASIEYIEQFALHQFELKVSNPIDGEMYFNTYQAEKNWAGLDEPVFYPVFNAFIDWIKISKQAAPSKAAAHKIGFPGSKPSDFPTHKVQ